MNTEVQTESPESTTESGTIEHPGVGDGTNGGEGVSGSTDGSIESGIVGGEVSDAVEGGEAGTVAPVAEGEAPQAA